MVRYLWYIHIYCNYCNANKEYAVDDNVVKQKLSPKIIINDSTKVLIVLTNLHVLNTKLRELVMNYKYLC